MGFYDEVESGDRRRALEALRLMLAQRIADRPRPRDLAALTFRLMKVMEALDERPAWRGRRRA